MYREYARALRGEKSYGVISGRKYKRMSMIAGKCGKKILAPLSYEGTTDSELFEYWFEKALSPELKAGQTIILDNATIHRKSKVRELAEKAMCSVVFLPPYSPDLNKIYSERAQKSKAQRAHAGVRPLIFENWQSFRSEQETTETSVTSAFLAEASCQYLEPVFSSAEVMYASVKS